jgi:hypothetical protein
MKGDADTMNRAGRIGIVFAVLTLGAAALAVGQLPGGYSLAPTNKDYRLAILEPQDGATLTGSDVTIVLSNPWVPSGSPAVEKERRDTVTPTFQIWVDGKNLGNLPIGDNTFTAHNLSEGMHRITVAAKNIAGELVERKEITIMTAAPAVSVSQTEAPAMVATAPPPPPAVVEPAPEPPQPELAPAFEPAAPIAPPVTELPKTATAYPMAAVAGLGLLVAGLSLRRRLQ